MIKVQDFNPGISIPSHPDPLSSSRSFEAKEIILTTTISKHFDFFRPRPFRSCREGDCKLVRWGGEEGGAPGRLWQVACWDSAQQDLRCAGNNILYHWWQAAARQGRPAACGKIKPFGQTCMQPTRKYVRRRCSRRVAAPTEPTLCLVGLLPRGGRWTSLDASFARCFAIF